MLREAVDAGFYTSPAGTQRPRLQILTVEQLLNGQKLDVPAWHDVRTFKKAPRAKGERPLPRLVNHFKLDARLSEEDRREYERLLSSPSSTVSSLMQWLADRGYHDISRGAAQRHRLHWQRDVLDIRRQAQAAHHFTLLARGWTRRGC